MKKFLKLEPSIEQTVGLHYKKHAVIKKFQTEDGLEQEFTTFNKEGSRAGAVIAITVDKKVVTTFQFRAGPERWMYELPGGGFNESEDSQAGALRELAEETGYRPTGPVEFLGTSFGDAYSNVQRYYFLATECIAGDTNLDTEEEQQGTEVRLISIAKLVDNAKADQMTDPAAVLMAYEKLKKLEVDNDEGY